MQGFFRGAGLSPSPEPCPEADSRPQEPHPPELGPRAAHAPARGCRSKPRLPAVVAFESRDVSC